MDLCLPNKKERKKKSRKKAAGYKIWENVFFYIMLGPMLVLTPQYCLGLRRSIVLSPAQYAFLIIAVRGCLRNILKLHPIIGKIHIHCMHIQSATLYFVYTVQCTCTIYRYRMYKLKSIVSNRVINKCTLHIVQWQSVIDPQNRVFWGIWLSWVIRYRTSLTVIT